MPLNHLLVSVVVSTVARETIRVNKTAQRVSTLVGDKMRAHYTSHISHQVRSVRIEFPSRIISLQVDLRLVNEANNLHIVRRFQKLKSGKSARWNEAGAMTRLRAPGDFFTLGIGDSRVGFRRCPYAEICEGLLNIRK